MSSSVLQEIEVAKQKFPKVEFHAATSHFCTVSYQRTSHRRVKLTLTFPEGAYPSRALIVDVLSSDSTPPGLKKKLENELGNAAKSLVGKYEQVQAVLGRMQNFIDSNKFVACWRELRQSIEVIQKVAKDPSGQGSTVAINDTKGLIKLKLCHGKYFYSCSITIDDAYPITASHHNWGKACHLVMNTTNFPPKIENMLTTQGKEIVRRMQDGMMAEEALLMSNPIKAPKLFDLREKDGPKVRLTQAALKGLKRDIDTLARVRDLRAVDTDTRQGNAKQKVHTYKERKDARRTVAKITEREKQADADEEQKEAKWQQEEKARLAGYDISALDGSTPQPSLRSLITFLVQKIQRLPEEVCPICETKTLPEDPTILASLYQPASDLTETKKKARRIARKKRPMRTYCGCWYHHECLDKFMTEPPFGAACPVDGRRVYHPEWPADIPELERAYMAKQARQREIDDVAMFL